MFRDILEKVFPFLEFQENPKFGLYDVHEDKKYFFDYYCEFAKLAIDLRTDENYKFPNKSHKTLEEFYAKVSDNNNKERICIKRGISLVILPAVGDHEFLLKRLKEMDNRSNPQTYNFVEISISCNERCDEDIACNDLAFGHEIFEVVTCPTCKNDKYVTDFCTVCQRKKVKMTNTNTKLNNIKNKIVSEISGCETPDQLIKLLDEFKRQLSEMQEFENSLKECVQNIISSENTKDILKFREKFNDIIDDHIF